MAERPDPARAAVGFVRVLRGAGIAVSTDSSVLFGDALAAVGWDRAEAVYWAARATLCRRPEDFEPFDVAFRSWFGRTVRTPDLPVAAPPDVVVALDRSDVGADEEPDASAPDAPVFSVRFSATEVLRRQDFATYSPAEHAEARRLLADLRVTGARRKSRRSVATHAPRRPDVRRTVRSSMRTGGEPVVRRYRRPSERPRRLVLLCDVSGSMEPYARVIVRFLHSAVVARTQVEAFALGTRLTRITRDLANRDPDAAIAAASRRVLDWSGGTRLGDTIKEFNDTWGVRGMARGAVVVVVSDGWDRGDAAVLGEQMQRLARVAHRIVWVNPLKAAPGFAPLAAGMAAALPFVDDFVEGHSLQSLSDLATVIEGA